MERRKVRLRDEPLGASEELAAAVRIESTEVSHWSTILAFSPAHAVLKTVLEQGAIAPEIVDELARLSSVASAAADKDMLETVARALREADTKRLTLADADAAVQRAFAEDPSAAAALLRIAAARRAQQEAKHNLVLANVALVRYFARRSARAAPMAELVQEGCIALMRAVELYDHRRGVRFSTYAVWWIRQAQNMCVSEQGSAVRAPLGALAEGHRIESLAWEVYGRTGEKPDRVDLGSDLGPGYKAYAGPIAHRSALRTTSLDESIHADGTTRRIDQLSAGMPRIEGELDMAMLRHALERGLAKLPALEATLLRQKFGLSGGSERSLRSIAHKNQLTYDRARTLCERGMRKLRREFARLGIDDLSCCSPS
jgi:RNA polymerase sigma factor (sigma-70 family)